MGAVPRRGVAALLLTVISLIALPTSALAQADPFAPSAVPQELPGSAQPFAPGSEPWTWQLLPDGLIYRSYLAGFKESRIGTAMLYESDQGWLWDSTLGGRIGLWRYGTSDPFQPEGWEIDFEGAAFPRLDQEHNSDLISADYRLGVPLTYRQGPFQWKLAFAHLSSHVGDEYLARHPSFERVNFSRNSVVFGMGYFATPDLRLYAEADYGFSIDVGSEPWWFQFGFDLAPSMPTGIRGAPFVAANALLREETDFGGDFTLMAGWAWRGERSGHLFRAGAQYTVGKATQFEFVDQDEQTIGFGLWYDF